MPPSLRVVLFVALQHAIRQRRPKQDCLPLLGFVHRNSVCSSFSAACVERRRIPAVAAPSTCSLAATDLKQLVFFNVNSSRVYAKKYIQMGKAVVDETEKGWYIQWVDRDPRLLAMQEAAARREKADLDDEEKQVCETKHK